MPADRFVRVGNLYPSPWRKYLFMFPVDSGSQRWWYLNNLNNVIGELQGREWMVYEIFIPFFSYIATISLHLQLLLSACLFSLVSSLQKYLQKWERSYERLLKITVYIVEVGQSMCLDKTSGWTWKPMFRQTDGHKSQGLASATPVICVPLKVDRWLMGKVGTQTRLIKVLILVSPFFCEEIHFLENGFFLPQTF